MALASLSSAERSTQRKNPKGFFCALIVPILVASAFLPGQTSVFVVLGAIILLGLPHGALDGEIARGLLRPRFGGFWFLVFSLPYLALSAVVLGLWWLAPQTMLAAFLIISALHFGMEEAEDAHWTEWLARGALPIAVPVLLHPGSTMLVLNDAAGAFGDQNRPAWLLAGAVAWLAAFIPWAAWQMVDGRAGALAKPAGLIMCFALLPPLTAFAIYFICVHAPAHMTMLIRGGRAERVSGWHRAVLLSLPLTAATVLLGLLLWPLYPGGADDRLLMLTLQGLAALTVPHLILDIGYPSLRRMANTGWLLSN